MFTIDWKNSSLSCPSLGNICGMAYATEYIRTILNVDHKVIVPEWYSNLWPMFIEQEKIIEQADSKDTLVEINTKIFKSEKEYGWIEVPVLASGFWMVNVGPFKPRICWLHFQHGRRILIYPREHHHGNKSYSCGYWIDICRRIQARGFTIVAMLDEWPSHRDGYNSIDWCNELRGAIKFDYVFEPRIEYLQAAVGLCKYSVGIMSGPSWLLLKSTINQFVLSSLVDESNYSITAEFNLPFFEKKVPIIPFGNFDWIDSL